MLQAITNLLDEEKVADNTDLSYRIVNINSKEIKDTIFAEQSSLHDTEKLPQGEIETELTRLLCMIF